MLYRQLYRAGLLVLACLTSACSPYDKAQAPGARQNTQAPAAQSTSVAQPAQAPRTDASQPDVVAESVSGAGREAADDDAGMLADAAPPPAGRGAADSAVNVDSTVEPMDRHSVECTPRADAGAPERLSVSGAIQLSDPALIESDGTFYAFSTGPGVAVRTSTDLLRWRDAGRALLLNPGWIQLRLDADPELWSPDISRFGGRYHLYYAASKQGSNRSCIGHASAAELPGPFEDHGAVLCSNVSNQQDDWNAIHPNYVEDEGGAPYLAFGSFWSGLKLVALDRASGAPIAETQVDLAARTAQGGAIEAPFIVRRCGYFYLFASFDRCCDGVSSTYKIHVGRAEKLTGPYLDRAGTPMLQGGGTPLVVADDTWRGPGHSAVFQREGRWYEAHHAYYAGDFDPALVQGEAYLRISELSWDADGWPASGGP